MNAVAHGHLHYRINWFVCATAYLAKPVFFQWGKPASVGWVGTSRSQKPCRVGKRHFICPPFHLFGIALERRVRPTHRFLNGGD